MSRSCQPSLLYQVDGIWGLDNKLKELAEAFFYLSLPGGCAHPDEETLTQSEQTTGVVVHDIPANFVIDAAVAFIKNHQANVRWQLAILDSLYHADLHRQAVVGRVVGPNNPRFNGVEFPEALDWGSFCVARKFCSTLYASRSQRT